MSFTDKQNLQALDKDGNEVDLKVIGNPEDALKIQGTNTELLNNILSQLKIINLHLQTLTDVCYDKDDIE